MPQALIGLIFVSGILSPYVLSSYISVNTVLWSQNYARQMQRILKPFLHADGAKIPIVMPQSERSQWLSKQLRMLVPEFAGDYVIMAHNWCTDLTFHRRAILQMLHYNF